MTREVDHEFIRQFIDKPRLRRSLITKATIPQLKSLVEFILNFDSALIPEKKKKSIRNRFGKLLKGNYKNLTVARRISLGNLKPLSEIVKAVWCGITDRSLYEVITHG